MSDTEFKVQWSISLPPAAQYAKGDMLNLRGNTVAEVEGIFDSVLNGEFIDKATQVGALLRAAAAVTDGLTPTADAPAQQGGSSDEPVAALHVCQHGKRVHKSGEKNGKKWEGWFCPEKQKANQCEVQWVN